MEINPASGSAFIAESVETVLWSLIKTNYFKQVQITVLGAFHQWHTQVAH